MLKEFPYYGDYLTETPERKKHMRTPLRPLVTISDIVAEKLPLMIAGSIPFPCEAELVDATKDVLVDPRHASLALLDAAMLECAFVHTGKQVPPDISNLVEALAERTKQIPGLTYEQLIHSNPHTTDPRTFTADTAAKSEEFRGEVLFYKVHFNIERRLASTIGELRYLCEHPDSTSDQMMVIPVVKALQQMDEGFGALSSSLSRDEFEGFRPFFSNAHRRLPGPSGLFSAGVYALDAYVAGNDPDMADFLNSKDMQRHCYPTTSADKDMFAGQQDMHEARTFAGKKDAILQRTNIYPNIRAKIASAMSYVRKLHLGIFMKFLPDAARDARIRGTGDQSNVLTFLQKPIQIYDAIAAKLSSTTS